MSDKDDRRQRSRSEGEAREEVSEVEEVSKKKEDQKKGGGCKWKTRMAANSGDFLCCRSCVCVGGESEVLWNGSGKGGGRFATGFSFFFWSCLFLPWGKGRDVDRSTMDLFLSFFFFS